MAVVKKLDLLKLDAVNKQEVFEIARLQDYDDFMGLEGLVRRGLAMAKEKCLDAEGVPLYRYQGAGIVLRELLDSLELSKMLSNDPAYRGKI